MNAPQPPFRPQRNQLGFPPELLIGGIEPKGGESDDCRRRHTVLLLRSLRLLAELHRNASETPAGDVLDLDFLASHWETKFIAIDKQANDDVVQYRRFGEADRFAGKPLDAGA